MSIDTIKTSLDMDEFDIAKTGNAFFPALSVANPGAGQFGSGEAITTIAHNLGYTPAIIINVNLYPGLSTYTYTCPYASNNVSTNFGVWVLLQAYADQNNLYLLTDEMVLNTPGIVLANAFSAQYFLLKEKIKRIV